MTPCPPQPPGVLHLISTDQRRGAERTALMIHAGLLERNWRSEVVSLQSTTAEVQVPTLGRGVRHPPTLLALRRRSRSFDVVLAHGSSTLPASALGLLGLDLPFVYANIGDPLFWAGTRARRWRTRRFLARARAVVAVSESAEGPLQDHLGVRREKLAVIRNGRSPLEFHPMDEQERLTTRAHYGLPAGPLAAVVGSLTHEKQIDVAILACALVPGLHLAVAGGGPLRTHLEAIARERLPGRATFTGPLAEPGALLAAADVVISTSASEGLPGVLIEAGLCAVPAVATDVGFVGDVIVDGVTGRLVPQGSAEAAAAGVQEVLTNRPSYAAAALARCRARYDLTQSLAAWDHLLREVVKRSSRGVSVAPM